MIFWNLETSQRNTSINKSRQHELKNVLLMIIVASGITPWSTILLRILIRIVVAENLNPKQSYLRRVQVCVCVRVCMCRDLYEFRRSGGESPLSFSFAHPNFFSTPFLSSGTLSIYCKRLFCPCTTNFATIRPRFFFVSRRLATRKHENFEKSQKKKNCAPV